MSMSSIGPTTNPQVSAYNGPSTAGTGGVIVPTGPGLGAAAAGGGTADVPQGGGPGAGDVLCAMTSPGSLPSFASEARISALAKQIEQQSRSASPDALVRALIESAGAQRKEAVTARSQARQAATSELMSEAGSMQKEASNMVKAAVVSLVVGVVASAASMVGTLGGAIRSVKGAAKELEHKGAGIEKNMAKIEHKLKDSSNALKELKKIKKEGAEGTLEQTEHLGMEKKYSKLSPEEFGHVKNFEKLQVGLSPIQVGLKKEAKISVAFDSLKNASELAQKSSEGAKGLLDSSNKQAEADQKGYEALQQIDSSREELQQTAVTNQNEMIQKMLELGLAVGAARADQTARLVG